MVKGVRRRIRYCLICLALVGMIPSWSAAEVELDTWLAGLKKQALQQGIGDAVLETAFKDFEPIPKVIELDRRQPEFTLTLEEYLDLVVSKERVADGRERKREYTELLEEVYGRYGVQPRFLVALWGVETHYGRYTGRYPVIDAVATLAFDGRRSAFFRKELLHALHIADRGHISVENMTGSWAGAMGQFQFMPSSFQRFAVDFDGDGRKDIWQNLGDAFASAANYLVESGWTKDRGWGQEVYTPPDLNPGFLDLDVFKTVRTWKALGVKGTHSQDLTESSDIQASLVSPDGTNGRAFMVYNNFRTLLRWNRSHLFAIAVGTLADRLSGFGSQSSGP